MCLDECPDMGADTCETLVSPGRLLLEGANIVFGDEDNAGMVLHAEILQQTEAGGRIVCFWMTGSHVAIERSEEIASRGAPGRASVSMVRQAIERVGYMPLPPYIHEKLADPDRYQTVYARINGSAAAPTAGLHFTPRLLEQLRQLGVRVGFVTLHVGLDTFRPV